LSISQIFLLKTAKPIRSQSLTRDGIQGFGLPPQANLLASVHTTLKRMKDAGEVKEIGQPLESGGIGLAYAWVEPVMVPLSTLLGQPVDVAFRRAHDAKMAREKTKQESGIVHPSDHIKRREKPAGQQISDLAAIQNRFKK